MKKLGANLKWAKQEEYWRACAFTTSGVVGHRTWSSLSYVWPMFQIWKTSDNNCCRCQWRKMVWRQTDRQTDRQTEIHSSNLICQLVARPKSRPKVETSTRPAPLQVDRPDPEGQQRHSTCRSVEARNRTWPWSVATAQAGYALNDEVNICCTGQTTSVQLHLYIRWYYGLRLSNFIKETTYLLT